MKERLNLLGLPLDPVDMATAIAWVRDRLKTSEPAQIVTLNPEMVIRSRNCNPLAQAIKEAELVTPDGVGILWAVKKFCGVHLTQRVTGIDLVEKLFKQLNDELNVFFLGGKPGIAEQAAIKSNKLYNINIAGFHHGYFDHPDEVVKLINTSGANLLLAGLGEKQEIFLHEHKRDLGVHVMIGVGGTLDVLAGATRRMPIWSQRLGLEWLLRVGGDPRRWPRGWRLMHFVSLVLLSKHENCQYE